eukprot:TRINITY_DN12207_c0_g1_i6.p1 TRINITY_DN12207_c0_g1~~TRINITY_DN12207_c0_g1_i6.p1  ORF type:complete len:111 (-),score=2.93 TRINITY_DN12207_c0_g1_i6:383-715(-)
MREISTRMAGFRTFLVHRGQRKLSGARRDAIMADETPQRRIVPLCANHVVGELVRAQKLVVPSSRYGHQQLGKDEETNIATSFVQKSNGRCQNVRKLSRSARLRQRVAMG